LGDRAQRGRKTVRQSATSSEANPYPAQADDERVVAQALENFRKRTAVDFSDCLILEIAKKAGHIPLATFDRDFGKMEGVQRLR
jgi:predicted nucleic acid-binding protein